MRSSGFLTSLLWPFIDGYYVALLSLTCFNEHKAVSRTQLLEKMQWLGKRLYQEDLLYSFDGCSLEVLQNALLQLREWGVVSITDDTVRLTRAYLEDGPLHALSERVGSFTRRVPGLENPHMRASLVAEFPMLARM